MRARGILTPQMAEYDRLAQSWLPYLMYFHTPNHSSAVVNTDSRGFRITHMGNERIANFKKSGTEAVNLLCGGSLAFGVGATSDAETIPSILSSLGGKPWLNFGGRAFNSTQEFLLFLFYQSHLKNIDNIVLLSGVNNLILHYLGASAADDEFGPFFFSQCYRKAMSESVSSLRKRIAGFILGSSAEKKVAQSEPCCGDSKERILDILERDIACWKVFCDARGIKLFYALQPFANWITKEISKEEKALFAELDCNPHNRFRDLKDKFDMGLYGWFAASLKEICKIHNILFLDLNLCLSSSVRDKEWIFVDRAHLNDTGNRYVAKAIQEKFDLK